MQLPRCQTGREFATHVLLLKKNSLEEADLRTLLKGIAFLNKCIHRRPGAGDGPSSVVLEFLEVALFERKVDN